MFMTTTNQPDPAVWTLETIAARRATGDSLVTAAGWCASYVRIGASKAATLHLYRPGHALGGLTRNIVETDPMDGQVFETTEHAELYALNAGRLQWFRDWKTQQASRAEVA